MPTTSKVSSPSKTKAVSKPATISKQFKSAELIEDSDDEDEENRVRRPPKPVKNSIAIESKPKPPKIKPKALPISVKSSPAIPNGKASTKGERNTKGERDSRSSVIILSSDSQTDDEESGTEETEVKNVKVDEDSEDEESSEGSSSGSENGSDSSSGDDGRKSYDGVPQSKKTAPTTYSAPMTVK